jgi:farnesol dehydrogenase
MNVLVTGGTGYLGRAIVNSLTRSGHRPVVFSRHARAAGLSGDAIDGDIRDRAAVDRAVAHVDAVCHAAALVAVWRRRSADFDDVNVGGLQATLEACERHRIRRMVYTSSFLALPPAGHTAPVEANDYQRTKVRARAVARAAAARGLPVTILYPGVLYGPGPLTEGNLVGGLIRDHLNGRLPGVIGSDHIWSYAHVDDVADAHVSALEVNRPGDYALGGENAPQMRIFEIVRDLTGRSLPRRIPNAIATPAALIHEWRAALAGVPPLLTRGVVKILNHDWPLESGASIERLRYRVTPLSEGLRALL